MARIILFDANFFMLPAQSKIPVYSELERLIPESAQIYIYSPILAEIEQKIKPLPPNAKIRREFNLAKQLLEHQPHQFFEIQKELGEYVDDFLIKQAKSLIASQNYVYIATLDRGLRKKCELAGISTIYARNQQTLEII